MIESMTAVPRYLPDRPFPPYTYVPGQAPHPISDPAGHMHGDQHVEPSLHVEEWWLCDEYLWGIDLFNYGYYWEAHEAWEGLWHAAGRRGPVADFLKGLIKLTAAGVKVREGNPIGQYRHATRAAQLFGIARDGNQTQCMGLSLNDLIATSHVCADYAYKSSTQSNQGLRMFELTLNPQRDLQR